MRITLGLIMLIFTGSQPEDLTQFHKAEFQEKNPYIFVLGNVQDGGSPHIGCRKECCKTLFAQPDPDRMVVALGIIDPQNEKTFLIEATPDLPRQLRLLSNEAGFKNNDVPDGVFLTHAHIGHYTGLMYFGREALGASQVNVYAMPGMKSFLESNGPWSQLTDLNNIKLQQMENETAVQVTPSVRVVPVQVPHRDEFSETVGYKIMGPSASLLFIPDIDKWDKWEKDIIEMVQEVDYALVDGSFYDKEEINNRDISEIPHPFVSESMELFDALPDEAKRKVNFIHFNHTNPLLNEESAITENVLAKGYSISRLKQIYPL